MSTEIPKILVLGAITPSPDSARAEQLRYDNLSPAVKEHSAYEHARMSEFWNAKEGSIEEREAATQLALQYMLMGSQALQLAVKPDSKRLWSERYTRATSELYGLPDPDLARRLWGQQEKAEEIEGPFAEAARKVGEYLDQRYAPVYDALQLDDGSDKIDPQGIADRFENTLHILAEQYDPDWAGWTIERNEQKDSLSVVARDKKIIVGMHRSSVEPAQLRGLFSHEVLVHGLRAVNGSKISEDLGNGGLAGYINAEEGLGVFTEYAITGEVPQKNIDRYVDIAYALGIIDGQEHTRSDLLEHAIKRAKERNELAVSKKSDADLEKEVYAHVNRIYRGSLGDEHVAIFTKDISYYRGFEQIARYIAEKIDEGYSVEELMTYLMQAKFDPLNELHTEVVGKLQKKV